MKSTEIFQSLRQPRFQALSPLPRFSLLVLNKGGGGGGDEREPGIACVNGGGDEENMLKILSW